MSLYLIMNIIRLYGIGLTQMKTYKNLFLMLMLFTISFVLEASENLKSITVDLNKCSISKNKVITFNSLYIGKTFDVTKALVANKKKSKSLGRKLKYDEYVFEPNIYRAILNIESILTKEYNLLPRTQNKSFGYQAKYWENGVSLSGAGDRKKLGVYLSFSVDNIKFIPELSTLSELVKVKSLFHNRIIREEKAINDWVTNIDISCNDQEIHLQLSKPDYRSKKYFLTSISLNLSSGSKKPNLNENNVIIAIKNPYKYPQLIKYNASCDANLTIIEKVKNQFSSSPHCNNKNTKVTPVDLNSDNVCEYFITYDWGRRCTPVTEIATYSKKTIKSIGEFKGGPIEAFGTKRNKYVRLINYTWGGHRTAMIFTTNVLYYNGENYICEFCKDNSHGGYIDLARKAYDQGNYDMAEVLYWNAYAMNGERKISDANNLALARIKNKKYKSAIKLLSKYLRYNNKKIIETERYPCYFKNCIPSKQKINKLQSSAYYNRGIAYEKLGNITKAISDFKASLNKRDNKSIKARVIKLKQ